MEDLIEVSYTMRFWDLWRGAWYTMFARWQDLAALFAPSFIMTVLVAVVPLAYSSWEFYVTVFVIVFLLTVAFTVLVIGSNIGGKLLTSRGPGRTRLMPEGVIDISGGKTTVLTWKQVRAIRFDHGDVHFWTSGSVEICVPRCAFPDLNAAKRFAEAGVMAMHGDTRALGASSASAVASHEPDVWPPSPSTPQAVAGSLISDHFDWKQWQANEKRHKKNQITLCLGTVLIGVMVVASLPGARPMTPAMADSQIATRLTTYALCVLALLGLWAWRRS